jgi:hypothetical protein
MFDAAALPDQIREVLSAARAMPLTAAEIFERLPCRDALLVECARQTDAFEAHERAVAWVGELLVKHLADEVRFDVVEGNGVAIELGHTLLTAPSGMVVVYRLRHRRPVAVTHF